MTNVKGRRASKDKKRTLQCTAARQRAQMQSTLWLRRSSCTCACVCLCLLLLSSTGALLAGRTLVLPSGSPFSLFLLCFFLFPAACSRPPTVGPLPSHLSFTTLRTLAQVASSHSLLNRSLHYSFSLFRTSFPSFPSFPSSSAALFSLPRPLPRTLLHHNVLLCPDHETGPIRAQ